MMRFHSRFLSNQWRYTRNLSGKGRSRKEKVLHKANEHKGDKKGLVLGAFETSSGYELTWTASQVNFLTGGKISEYLEGARLKLGQATIFADLSPLKFDTVAVASLGEHASYFGERENFRVASAAGVLALEKMGVHNISIEHFSDERGAAEGAQLAVWKMPMSKGKYKDTRISPYTGSMSEEKLVQYNKVWTESILDVSAHNVARDLESWAPNVLTPCKFAEKVFNKLQYSDKVDMHIRDLEWIKKQGLSAFLKVAEGSCENPCLLELHYHGERGGPPLGFIGQGTTYDSGGICLKSPEEMTHTGVDRAGAAVLAGLIEGAIKWEGWVRDIIGLIPLYENMPGGLSLKPGDVISSYAGKTIRFQNTSNDAAVVMGDVISFMSNFDVKDLYTIGTLSHKGMTGALADFATGVFSTSNDTYDNIEDMGKGTGDPVWRLPLWDLFSKRITNVSCCDLQNEATIKGGDPCVAAAFLKAFLPDSIERFTHLDISGTGNLSGMSGKPYLASGVGSGRPTRTLLNHILLL